MKATHKTDLGEWKIRDKVAPGHLGAERDDYILSLDQKFGEGNWMFGWVLDEELIDFVGACKTYEESYYQLFVGWPGILSELARVASDVYDDAESNVNSGLDYNHQETSRTHIQDIAIRNCAHRLGVQFSGDKLIQIRGPVGKNKFSYTLCPGAVPFHTPELITTPTNVGDFTNRWWIEGSVEDFYQRNRRILIRR